ncbi:uncharacterized protein LOC116012804 [Ipomoea triloba]|uniref:uncharacterized protein LOC116012804 n=1 Tax=Ipomoea triloba TaxID=35885 RepID=UPI00125E31C3|nr:uncharacterized protein LOC116012804 [Ipomoea triloba]
MRVIIILFALLAFVINFSYGNNVGSWGKSKGYKSSSIITRLKTIHGDIYNCVNIYKQPGMNHPTMATERIKFAGLLIGNAPSERFTGAKATMTIWNPTLRGENQYSSASLYVEDGDNQIRVGWIVHPALYGDSRTRLFSRWTSDNYGKTGCYINHCPGFVMTSNVVSLDYAFPNMSVLRGEQFDVTLQVVKRSTGDWEFNYNGQQLGTWTSSIFSKMGESASQLRFGGECYQPEIQDVSPQMGSGGRFRKGKYDRTAYMRQLSYTDTIYGDAVLDDSMVQVQTSRCYYATNEGYNFNDDWYGYNFMYGGKGGKDGAECFDDSL